MTTPTFIMAAGAPTPVAPFSHAVRVGAWVLVTGQMPTTPGDDEAPLAEGVRDQTRRVLDNLALVLDAAGCTLSDVVQARVYLTDFERDYAALNDVWRATWPPGRLPARTCIGVTALARGALVEVDLVAYKEL